MLVLNFVRSLLMKRGRKEKGHIGRAFIGIVLTVILTTLLSSSAALHRSAVNAAPLRADGISFLGSLGTVSTKASAAELRIAVSQEVRTGDDIFVALATDPNQSMVVDVTDDAGNEYVQIGSTVINTGEIRTYLFVAYDANSMAAASEIIIAIDPTVTSSSAVAVLFSGLADGDPLDQLASSTGVSTSPASGATATTGQADELLIGVVGTEGPEEDEAGTWGDAFIAGPRIGTTGGDGDSNISVSLGYKLVSATGEYSASKTGITERDWTALIATFEADPVGDRPSIFITGTPLSEFAALPGGMSGEQSYFVAGELLTESVIVSAPEDFEISLTSGSGFASELTLGIVDGSLAETEIFVRYSKAIEGTSEGEISHSSAGATTRVVLVSGVSAPINPVEFNILLARPTNESITANIIPDTDVEFYVEYGIESGVYPDQTITYDCLADEVVEFVIDGLSADTEYFYHLTYRQAGITEWNQGDEHHFRTQRPPENAFTFTIASDSHLGQYGGQDQDELDLYAVTLENVEGDNPDFHIDLGDTYAMDPSPLGSGMTPEEAMAAYYVQRPFLGEITHSIPYYQVIGNHENEEGWNFDDEFADPDQSLAIVGMAARKYYIPIPIDDGFYTANTDPLDEPIGGDTNHEDYYAWEWGDALFVVLDPYHYSTTWPDDFGEGYGGEGTDGEESGDRWDWTLGIEQYLWFKETLENSTATYKMVFAHHVTGGSTPYGRGGIDAAPYFEWGGYNADDTWGWDEHRPAAEGWDLPIHQMMVANGVNVFFHGHDHIYAREELDGIVYIEVAKPDDAGYDWQPYGYGYNEDLYPNAISILPNSGYMRVNVSPENMTIEYVRSYLPGDGTNGSVADTVVIEPPGPPILGDVNDDEAVNSTDALIILKGDVGLDISSHCPMNCGDVNGDGYVNSTDALLVLKYDVGLGVLFPIGEEGCPASITQPPGCVP